MINKLKRLVISLIVVISFLAAVIFFLLMLIFRENPLLYDIFKTLMLLFAITLIIRILDKVFLQEQLKKEMYDVVNGIVTDRLEIHQHFQKYGLEKICDTFDFKKIFNEVEDYGELKILDTYIPTYAEFLPQLTDALRRNVKIKILYVNPYSKIAKLRSEELGEEYREPNFSKGVEGYISQIACKVKENGLTKNIELSYYEDLPCMPMYFIKNKTKPNKLIFSFFLSKESVNYYHFDVIEKPRGIFADFEKYFDAKWKKNEGNKLVIPKYVASIRNLCDDI
ncbi:hypothetical protein METP3_00612 [Methanosarcinales archaeon]|nr:hypothetical protein METP3_00612 [Methanosarcinales archaeon]